MGPWARPAPCDFGRRGPSLLQSGPVVFGFVAIVRVFLLLLNDRFLVCGYGSVQYESGMVLRNCISEASDFILIWDRILHRDGLL